MRHYEEQTEEEATAEDEAIVRIVESGQEARLVTDLLKQAFEAASWLPKSEQDAVAEWLLAELASEEKWDERFAETQGALPSLAREALDEHKLKNRFKS